MRQRVNAVKRWGLFGGVVLLAGLAALPAGAYDRLVVFGDSLRKCVRSPR